MSLADLGRMFGVKPSTLANLRARDPEFPRPASTRGRALLYEASEAQAYCRLRYGSPLTGDVAPARSLNDLPDLPATVLAGQGMYLADRPGVGASATPAQGITAAMKPPAAWAAQVSLSGIQDFARRAEADDLPALEEQALTGAEVAQRMDELIAALSRDSAGRLLPTASADSLVEWMLATAGKIEGTLADPACGLGLLLARASDSATGVVDRVVGFDWDPQATRITALRLLGHGVSAELSTIDPFHALEQGGEWNGACDVVLIDAPFGTSESKPRGTTTFGRPPVGEQAFAWLALAFDLLSPGGRAVVAAPLRTVTAPGRAAKFRQQMLAAGAITAVIVLPGGMRPGSAPDLALWVLQRPKAPGLRPVLSVDGQLLRDRHGPSVATEVVRPVVGEFRRHPDETLRLPSHVDSRAFRVITAQEQTSGAVDLSPWGGFTSSDSEQDSPSESHDPARHETAVDSDERALRSSRPTSDLSPAELADSLEDVEASIRQFRSSVAHQTSQSSSNSTQSEPLISLIRRGYVQLFERRPGTDLAGRPTPFHMSSLRPTNWVPGRDEIPEATSLEPGDVLIGYSTGSYDADFLLRAVVHEEGRPLTLHPESSSRGVQVLRIAKPPLTPDWLTAEVLADAVNATGSEFHRSRFARNPRPADFARLIKMISVPTDSESQSALRSLCALSDSVAALSAKLREVRL